MTVRRNRSPLGEWWAAAVFLVGLPTVAFTQDTGLDVIMRQVGTLESRFDPKCHATASRLEDFMFGTPLTTEARCAEHLRQKVWMERLAERALSLGGPDFRGNLTESEIGRAAETFFEVEGDAASAWVLKFPSGEEVRLEARDVRQYGSVAYSLRSILALQQDRLLRGKSPLNVDPSGLEEMKRRLDLASLSVLKKADRLARQQNETQLTDRRLEKVWGELFPEDEGSPPTAREAPKVAQESDLARRIIDEKVKAYAAYNEVSNQLFVRNMQVFLARLSWPRDAEAARQFRSAFVEAIIAFGVQLYEHAHAEARKRGHAVISEADVHRAAQGHLPYAVNAFEDVVFFPYLPPSEQVAIESYDMDAFRDSGNHWRYLGFAIEDPKLKGLLEADPFALELLAENLAQFGVLILRLTGEEGIAREEERLSLDLLAKGFETLQNKIDRHRPLAAGSNEEGRSGLLSAVDTVLDAGGVPASEGGRWFLDVTKETRIDYLHRSSDWLNRLLRSYLDRGEGRGVITVPPAFGGSGLAAEDVDDDGDVDLLLLGGRGARLYLNEGSGAFKDHTHVAGIDYRRPDDKQAGEMRQPLIADFDNDGIQDLIITYVNESHRVYRGLGGARFQDVTATAKLGGEGLVGGPATVFDYDRDGLLDVYVVYFGNFVKGVLPTLKRHNKNGSPNRLFRNLGGFRFEDVTETAGVGDVGWGQAVLHTDLDGDHWQDLIAGNDFGVNAYYINQGDGTFQEVSQVIGTGKPSYSMSLSASDLNGDTLPDIYVSNIVTMNKDEKYVLPNESTRMKFNLEKLAHLRVVEANDLFLSGRREDGKIAYTLSDAVGRGHSSTGWAWDADFFDPDHDGDDDLYVLNGMNEFNLYSSRNPYFMDAKALASEDIILPVAAVEKNAFFVNHEGRLDEASEASGLDLAGNSRSAAYFDLEGDGDLDVLVGNYHGSSFVYKNLRGAEKGAWIKIKLLGDSARGVNRDAIGAKLFIELSDGRLIRREVHGSTGYMSVHPKEVHAGVGTAETVDVEVIWPDGSGSRHEALTVGQRHVLRFGKN